MLPRGKARVSLPGLEGCGGGAAAARLGCARRLWGEAWALARPRRPLGAGLGAWASWCGLGASWPRRSGCGFPLASGSTGAGEAPRWVRSAGRARAPRPRSPRPGSWPPSPSTAQYQLRAHAAAQPTCASRPWPGRSAGRSGPSPPCSCPACERGSRALRCWDLPQLPPFRPPAPGSTPVTLCPLHNAALPLAFRHLRGQGEGTAGIRGPKAEGALGAPSISGRD